MSGRRRGRARKVHETFESQTEVIGLDDMGRGVGRDGGKVVFITGALPGERVRYRCVRRLRSHDEAELLEVLEASPERVQPKCAHHEMCGGCTLQHLSAPAQLEAKQQVVVDALLHIGGVEPQQVLPALSAIPWAYRRKARLGVKYVPGKGGVLVGFREKRMPYIAEIDRCEVLLSAVGSRITQLREMLGEMDAKNRIPQIEVAAGDNACALIFRTLDPLGPSDLQRLRDFAAQTELAVYLQPGGYESVSPLWPTQGVELGYQLSRFQLSLTFNALDFVQVNGSINEQLVGCAVDSLEISSGDRVLDLFCGLGNFSLAIARSAGDVLGLELSPTMVDRAAHNAALNGIDNCRFASVDLTSPLSLAPWRAESFDKLLLDPPRSGAREVVDQLAAPLPSRIVYISCNPATLARDANVLVHTHHYRLRSCRAVDMFPHTSHVEALAVFEHERGPV